MLQAGCKSIQIVSVSLVLFPLSYIWHWRVSTLLVDTSAWHNTACQRGQETGKGPQKEHQAKYDHNIFLNVAHQVNESVLLFIQSS